MEGSFDNDVLIGDGGHNAMLGQPGEDRFYGSGGEDMLDARDGVRDAAIQCAPGTQIVKGSATCAAPRATPSSTPSTRTPVSCGETTIGHPVKGLGKTHDHEPGASARARPGSTI